LLVQKSWILMQKFTYLSQKWYAARPKKNLKLRTNEIKKNAAIY
jgi:hypothetical protein